MEGTSASVGDAWAQANPDLVGLSKQELEIIWQMSMAYLPTNNNELVVPNFMAVSLSEENINDLKDRFRYG